ncbi:MAG TPA: allantoinase AllB [Bacteroidota bacterium]|jgi:allantoinase
MPENSSTLILRSRRVVTPEGVREASVLIRDGIIADILFPGSIGTGGIPEGASIEDVGDSVVMPGLVDTHVHINEPGRTEWEGFETATRAAAAGGITTLVDMPLNSTPVTTSRAALEKKIEAAKGKLSVDCGFYAGIVPGSRGDLDALIGGGVLGVKAFLIHSGIDDFPNVREANLREAMPLIARAGLPLLVHCELTPGEAPVSAGTNPRSYPEYLASRPRRWEHDAIDLMIRLCREYSCKVHIVHVSSADALQRLEESRKSGLPLTTETCPHYLYFVSEEIPDGDTRFKCAPPIRERENRDRLWNGLKRGVLDFIVSDHSPSLPELKHLGTGDFQKAWGGIASLQLGLSIVWTEAAARGFSLSDVANWMCSRPAKFVGLETSKGTIAPGNDGDLVVWNPEEEFTVEPSMLFHKHRITPYEGRKLRGRVEMTFLRGRKIYERGEFKGPPAGTVLLRQQTKAL